MRRSVLAAALWLAGCHAALDPSAYDHDSPPEVPSTACASAADCVAGAVCDDGACEGCWRSVSALDVPFEGALTDVDVLFVDEPPAVVLATVVDELARVHVIPVVEPSFHLDGEGQVVESIPDLPPARRVSLANVDAGAGGALAPVVAVFAGGEGSPLRIWLGDALDRSGVSVDDVPDAGAIGGAALLPAEYGEDGPRAWAVWTEPGAVRGLFLPRDELRRHEVPAGDALPFLAASDRAVVVGADEGDAMWTWVPSGDDALTEHSTPGRIGPAVAARRAASFTQMAWPIGGARAELVEHDCQQRCGGVSMGDPVPVWGQGPLAALAMAPSRVGPVLAFGNRAREGDALWLTVSGAPPELGPKSIPAAGRHVRVDDGIGELWRLRASSFPRGRNPWAIAFAEAWRDGGGSGLRVRIVRACGTSETDLLP